MANGTHDSFQDKPGPCVPIASSIPVLIGNRKRLVNLLRNRKHSTDSANSSNLASIPRQPQPVPNNWADNVFKTLKLALLNIRSSINDFIIKHNLDLMFLIETWLDQNNSAAVLTESTPPNFNFMSEARVHKKGGGVAILYNDSLQCKQISYGTFASLEYVALQLNSSSRAMFLNIYRPPKYCAFLMTLLNCCL